MEVPLISVHLAIGVCSEKGAGLAGIGSVKKRGVGKRPRPRICARCKEVDELTPY